MAHRNPVSRPLVQKQSILKLLHFVPRTLAAFDTNLFTALREIDLGVDMRVRRREIERALAVTFLTLTLALVVGGVLTNAEAYQSPPYPFPPTFPVNNFDFTLTTSATLIKIQQGQTGGLFVWVNLFCPNSTTNIRCDSTVLQTIYLSVSGCPSGALCVLSNQVVQVTPVTQAASNLVVYTFFGGSASSSPTLVTVSGIDQFGDAHSVTFGVVICYC